MKRSRLRAWPLLVVCYLGLALTVLASSSSSESDVRLKVSIRKDLLGVPSCQHTFSQIELLNLVSVVFELFSQ